MKGAISSVEWRDACDYLLFNIDERSFNPQGARVITKAIAIDGTGLTNDWGYPFSNIIITVTNFFLSESDYDKLIGMKEDDDNTFLFHFRNRTYKVIIQNAQGTSNGNRILINTLGLSVVEKFPDGETA